IVLDDGGPQRPYEAISFFTDVITHHAGHAYAVASRLGVGEALATLERHDGALEAFRIAIEELSARHPGAPRGLINRDVLRVSLGMMSQHQRAGGDLGAALAYAELAAELVDPDIAEQRAAVLQQLGQAQELRAQELGQDAEVAAADQQEDAAVRATDLTERSGMMFARAAATFVTVSQIHTLNEWRSADSSWRAAELFTRAGQLGRAVKLFRAFATERPDHSLVPRAWLRIGQLHQAMGDLSSAIQAYKQCYRDYPRTLDGSRALIPLARCYLALGLDNDPLAEKTLHLVLEDSEVFTPEAPEFADALFLMGEVLNRRGEYERAIGTLEEALDRYPDDPRAWHARPLLADSYRQSGLVLKKEVADATTAAEIAHIREESVGRFQRARELYRMLITQNELRGRDPLEWLEKLNLRHAYVYEADCYYEVGDHREALRRYEEVAGMYKDTPTALAAYVQIINCHAFLGQPDEARAALARARILVSAIPQEAFDNGVSPEGRKDWQRYFESLGDAELF
ncbi:MAG: tetratricopeptide repeat protein, partial [Planctomycetes bacterium]|nr:tetratricopeptide repeat protein [Planctomycetota bacterium]